MFPSRIDLTPYMLAASKQDSIARKCAPEKPAADGAKPGAESNIKRPIQDLCAGGDGARAPSTTTTAAYKPVHDPARAEGENGSSLRCQQQGAGAPLLASSASDDFSAASKAMAGRARAVAHELVAVLVHEGSATGGHYITYRRLRHANGHSEGGISDSWFCASDESVHQVSLDDVLQACPSMLMYEESAMPCNGSSSS